MTTPRLFAIMGIFFCTMIAWFILAGSISFRTDEKRLSFGPRMASHWGGVHKQETPQLFYHVKEWAVTKETSTNAAGTSVTVEKSSEVDVKKNIECGKTQINADFEVDYRQKGLLWYSVYKVRFSGLYTFTNPSAKEEDVTIDFTFPAAQAIYDDFVFQWDGQELLKTETIRESSDDPYRQDSKPGSLRANIKMKPGQIAVLKVGYTSQGTGTWEYSVGEGTKRVTDFQLTAQTHFKEFDIPEFSISPGTKTETADGWSLVWQYKDIISDVRIGLGMPKKLDPGPVAERISFFAPVSLLFFFCILIIIGAIRDVRMHPMNYFFLAAAFFSFHLLFAYLVDHLALELSFAISSIVSVTLVAAYMRLVTSWPYTVRVVMPTQVIYLILFSYSFFFEGYTGLTITIGAIVTLFILMQMTGKTDWNAIFKKDIKS